MTSFWNGSGSVIRSNGTFTGSSVWQQDAAAGTDILSTNHDLHDEGLADSIEACICKNGENSPTNDLPMATFKHTGVGDAAALTQYASAKQIVYDSLQYVGTSSGAANTYTVSATIAPTANTAGMRFCFKSHQLNTGSSTFNIGALSLTFKRPDGTSLSGSEIPSAAYVIVRSDGTNAVLEYVQPIWTTWTSSPGGSGSMTYSSVSVDYARYQRQIDGRVNFEISFSGTTGGVASTSLTFALPIAPVTAGTIFTGSVVDSGYKLGFGLWTAGFTVNVYKYDSSNYGLGATRGVIMKGSYVAA